MKKQFFSLLLVLIFGSSVNCSFEEWLRAIDSDNNIARVEMLVENGHDVNDSDQYNRTPLLLAIYKNNVRIVEILIKNGAKLDPVCSHGDTPLLMALKLGCREISSILVEKGADIYFVNRNDQTPLTVAAQHCDSYTASVLELLLKKACDEERNNSDLLLWLSSYAPKYIYELAINSCDADVNSTDSDGRTPLRKKAAIGSLEAVETLISLGANVNVVDDEGRTPLSEARRTASFYGNGVVNKLLNAGAKD